MTSKSITPSTILEGDTVLYAGSTDGDAIKVTAPGGAQTASGGSTLSQKGVPTIGGTYTFIPSRQGVTGTSATVPLTFNPLTAQAGWSGQSVPVGQQASCTVDAPAGTDKVYATINGVADSAAGNHAVFNFTPTQSGTYTCAPSARNNAVTKNGTAKSIDVVAAPSTITFVAYDIHGQPYNTPFQFTFNGQTQNITGQLSVSAPNGSYGVDLVQNQANVWNFLSLNPTAADSIPLNNNWTGYQLAVNGNMTIPLTVIARNDPALTATDIQCIKDSRYTNGAVVGIPGIAVDSMEWYFQTNAIVHPYGGFPISAMTQTSDSLWEESLDSTLTEVVKPMKFAITRSADIFADGISVVNGVPRIRKGVGLVYDSQSNSGGPQIDANGHIEAYEVTIQVPFQQNNLDVRRSEEWLLADQGIGDGSSSSCSRDSNGFISLSRYGVDIILAQALQPYANVLAHLGKKNLNPFN